MYFIYKSQFIEMFGDPIGNPKQWNKTQLGEIFEIKTGAVPMGRLLFCCLHSDRNIEKSARISSMNGLSVRF